MMVPEKRPLTYADWLTLEVLRNVDGLYSTVKVYATPAMAS